MRTGGESGHTHKADTLSGVNMFADVNENSRKVHVHCFVAIRVSDANQISGTTRHSRKSDVSVADRLNRRTDWRAIINAEMRPIRFYNRVVARLAEMRCN